MTEEHEKRIIEQAKQLARNDSRAAEISQLDAFGDSGMGDSEMVMGNSVDQTVSRVFPSLISPGTEISRYRVIKKIGEGGMGEVYLAQHVKFQKRLFAIKFLRNDIVSPESKSRFEAEINAMEDLRHDNVIFAHDAGEFQGISYLVMDFVEGLSIRDVAKKDNKIRVSEAAEIIRQAAVGLQHAHELNMVHRDIKPSNLMLTREGVVKILDMGLARFTDEQATDLTGTQQILGTPDYMAPEQWQSTKSVDIRADIYSLGCTLYCLLAGRAPFEDEHHSTLATKLSGHLQDDPPRIDSEKIESGNQAILNVLDKMLAKEADDRYQTPAELANALEEFCDGVDLSGITRGIQPIEYDSPTRSIKADSEETEDKPTAKPLPSKQWIELSKDHWKRILGLGVLCLIVLLIVFRGKRDDRGSSDKESAAVSGFKSGEKTEPQKDADGIPKLDRSPFSITLITRDNPDLPANDPAQELTEIGLVGVDTSEGRLGDLLKIKAELPAPKYCYLVALNPTNDPDYRIQLCYPESAEEVPERISAIVYPNKESKYFGMTDGIGQQAFVILASDVPLPSFEEWKEKNLNKEFPWVQSMQTGIWGSNQNGEITRIFAREARAFRGGVVEVKSNVLQKSVEYLQSKEVDVTVIAFPIRDY